VGTFLAAAIGKLLYRGKSFNALKYGRIFQNGWKVVI